MDVVVDQASQDIYVAELTTNLKTISAGQIEQLSPSGTATADSPFGTGGQDFFSALAVNPVTHGIYAYQTQAETPFGPKGESKLSSFSTTGALGSSFSPSNSTAASLASDSSGRVYFPSSATGAVQIFSSTGALEGTVTCSACVGGAFTQATGAAFDSAGDLYVVDRGNGGRVVKLAPSGGSYAYQSTLQSGAGSVAVAVDTSSDDVFVGDLVNGTFHVVAYSSSGTLFDDFGLGLVKQHEVVTAATGALAANATTHELYLSDPLGKKLWVFERIASIPAPTAGVIAPTGIGQVGATLQASVDPKGHTLSSCHFEYTDHADFLAHGYANAKSVNCAGLVGGTESTTISAKANGLAPGTDYDYRVQVGSYGGGAEAGPQTFETLPPLPPEVAVTSAGSITTSGASLKGSVNPKGGAISNCHFEYVAEAAFQQSGFTGAPTKICSPTNPSGTAAVAVSVSLSGLAAGTAYHYRVVATNNSGTTAATDATFSTEAESCSANPALCPAGGGGTPPATTLPPLSVTPPAAPPQPKALKCRKGFKKKRVHGKLRCVKLKKHRSKH